MSKPVDTEKVELRRRELLTRFDELETEKREHMKRVFTIEHLLALVTDAMGRIAEQDE